MPENETQETQSETQTSEISAAPPQPPKESETDTPPANAGVKTEPETVPTDISSDEKILRELQALKQSTGTLVQQLNEKERLPQNYLRSFISEFNKQTQPLLASVQGLQEKIKELVGSVKFTSDFVQRTEDERVKTLYAENEKYKAGLVKKFEDELLTNVIRQIDESEKTVKRIEGKISAGQLTAEEVLASVLEIITDFKDMLQDRYGLTEFTSPAGATADGQHRITPRRETTIDINLNGKVAKSVSCGYKDKDGNVFRQESVVVYRFEPAADTEIHSASSSDTGRAAEVQEEIHQDGGTVLEAESEEKTLTPLTNPLS